VSDCKNPPLGEVYEINFAFREKLDSVAEGFRHNFCYQCGACVADCPANIYSDRFNPRLILLKAILGFEDELIGFDSEIWECTNCYTCSERCPQDVRPVDVIIALKNLCAEAGVSPDPAPKIAASVIEAGMTTKVTSLSEKRRQQFGLGPIKKCPVDEIQKMLEDD
jgi:heterodisulfide reductase subunit C